MTIGSESLDEVLGIYTGFITLKIQKGEQQHIHLRITINDEDTYL